MVFIVNKPENMYCTNCSAQISTESKYCFSCGVEVKQSYSKKIKSNDEESNQNIKEKVIYPFWGSKLGVIIRWLILLPVIFGLLILLLFSTRDVLEPDNIFQFAIFSFLVYLISVLSYKIAPNKKRGFYITVPIISLLSFTMYLGSKEVPILMWQSILTGLFFFIGYWMKLKKLTLKKVFSL